MLTKARCLKKKNAIWIKGHTRKGYRRSNGVFVRAARVKAHCRIYDKEEMGILSRLRDGKPEGWYGTEEFRKWSDEEKTRVLQIIKHLPHKLLKEIEFNIFRAKRGSDPKNPAISVPNPNGYKIFLYDNAFSKKFNLYDVVIHETAHLLYPSMNHRDRERYLVVSQWFQEKSKGSYLPRRKIFVKGDGTDSPGEDFANNVESYFSHRGLLKRKNPDIYRWMENYFK